MIHLADLAKQLTPAHAHIARTYVALHATGRPITPSLAYTADQLGLDEKTVRRANASLMALGWLTVRKERTPGKPWSHNVYELAGDLLAAALARAARIAAATARLAKQAGAEAVRLHRRLWHRKRAATPGKPTPDILPNDLSFSVFQTKKETPQAAPTSKSQFLKAWDAGKIPRPDLSAYRTRR